MVCEREVEWHIFTACPLCARPCLEFWPPGAFALKIRNTGAAQAINRHFSKEDTWPANKWLERSSKSLQSRQCKSKRLAMCSQPWANWQFENQKIPKYRRVVNASGSGSSLSRFIPCSAIPSRVIWGHLLPFSVPLSLCLSSGDDIVFISKFLGGLCELFHVRRWESCLARNSFHMWWCYYYWWESGERGTLIHCCLAIEMRAPRDQQPHFHISTPEKL